MHALELWDGEEEGRRGGGVHGQKTALHILGTQVESASV